MSYFKAIVSGNTKPKTILMSEMEPGQLGRILAGRHEHHIVMRTLSTEDVEIMDLSDPTPDSCWTGCIPDRVVELLPPGTIVQLLVE
jgi:hypothetical protein